MLIKGRGAHVLPHKYPVPVLAPNVMVRYASPGTDNTLGRSACG